MKLTSVAGVLLLAAAGPVLAGEHRKAQPLDPRYVEECGSCHVAFPPRGLAAASWTAVFADLSTHFGVDASLDPAAAQPLLDYVRAHARRKDTPGDDGKPALRMTKARWFVREHDEVAAATWQRPAIETPSNCAACHPAAEQGSFAEHDIRIPR
ncbi:MAG: diheme cytochrome c [Gammaproteobacteria bacterium]|nr:diheme cytochrome c [Gammaproteobacteria bacterium]